MKRIFPGSSGLNPGILPAHSGLAILDGLPSERVLQRRLSSERQERRVIQKRAAGPPKTIKEKQGKQEIFILKNEKNVSLLFWKILQEEMSLLLLRLHNSF